MKVKICLLSLLFLFININCNSSPILQDAITLMIQNAQGDIESGFHYEYTTGPLVITANTNANKNIALQMIINTSASDIDYWKDMQIDFNANNNYEKMSNSDKGSVSITGSGVSKQDSGEHLIVAKIIATTGRKTIETTLTLILKVFDGFISNFILSKDEMYQYASPISAQYQVNNNTDFDLTILDASLAFTSNGGEFSNVTHQFNIDKLGVSPSTLEPYTHKIFEFLIWTTNETETSDKIEVSPIIQNSSEIRKGSSKNITTWCWEELPDLPENLSGAVAGIFKNSIFVLGGAESFEPLQVSKKIWMLEYSEGNFSWKDKGNLHYSVYHSGIAWSSDAIYLVGGITPQGIPEIPETNKEIQKFDGNSTVHIGDLEKPRAGAAVVLHNNNLYIFGGYTKDNNVLTTIEKFDLTTNTRFDYTGNITEPTCLFAGFVEDFNYYLVGGSTRANFSVQGRDTIIHSEIDKNVWHANETKLDVPSAAYTFGYNDGTCWIAGGIDENGNVTDAFQRISLRHNTSQTLDKTPEPVFNAAGLVFDGYFYLLGGQGDKGNFGITSKCYRFKIN